ncbi:MAG: hypothetical protein ABIJ50_04110 [Pseudomonadota bacterium]
MNKIPQTKNIFIVPILLLASLMLPLAQDALAISASTSLTIVNVTQYLGPLGYNGRETWDGDWPSSPDVTSTTPSGEEVYLDKAFFTAHSMGWTTTPYNYPYRLFPSGLNAVICNVWSTNKGQTFTMGSWDYLLPSVHYVHLEESMPDCWMGIMVHSYCDFVGTNCNGRKKTNLYFTENPSGATGCWGSAIKQ